MEHSPEVAAEKYVVHVDRTKFGLCLSGGGYRAALFHLGAVRRLNELGLLGKIDEISSVSGGSIFAAFLAMRIPNMTAGKLPDYANTVAIPFRAFTKTNIRTRPALIEWVGQLFEPGAGAKALEAEYEERLVPGKTLADLPCRPRFKFCATDVVFGVNWVFERDAAGDYRTGHMSTLRTQQIPLARAVAASSCFPPVFAPLPMNLDEADLPVCGKIPAGDPQRNDRIAALSLADGGVYDNMGLEPLWKHCKTLLVSDGGKPFGFSTKPGRFSQLERIVNIIANQAESLRKRWLIASYINQVYEGAYFGVGTAVADYNVPGVPGYSNAFVKEAIATIRTDLNTFTDPEIAVLENHGYYLAEAAIKVHLPALYPPDASLSPPWPDFAPSTGDNSGLETRLRSQLAASGQ